ncbi:hypothetical protein CRG98_030756 [Punica granatum]|uniref:Uncharacterized protein n=1 Tax=Punica granatum TaxID=22663 RepID=A0A2I0IYP0_PUNGR|nr:hypothetical protein CRG98_030756 [Punica granatum]
MLRKVLGCNGLHVRGARRARAHGQARGGVRGRQRRARGARAHGVCAGGGRGCTGACGYGCIVHSRARSSPEMRKST